MTNMAEYTNGALAKILGKTKEEIEEDYLNSIPLGRLGRPDDVANLVSFLVSKEADYITGQSIMVNGGMLFS